MTYSLSLIFSSAGYGHNKHQAPAIPTYITILPRKDGITAKTKRLNPQRGTSKASFSPLKRKLKASSSNFSAILPKFRVRGSLHDRRPSSLYSSNSSNSNLPDNTKSSTYYAFYL